jgi:hypothetical protein
MLSDGRITDELVRVLKNSNVKKDEYEKSSWG